MSLLAIAHGGGVRSGVARRPPPNGRARERYCADRRRALDKLARVGPLHEPVRAPFRRSLRLSASSRYPDRGARGGRRLKSICQNGTPPPGQGGEEKPVYISLPPPVTPLVCPVRDGGRYEVGGHARRGECRTEDAERDQATALPKGLGLLRGCPEERGPELGEGKMQSGLVGPQAREPQIPCACASDVRRGLWH